MSLSSRYALSWFISSSPSILPKPLIKLVTELFLIHFFPSGAPKFHPTFLKDTERCRFFTLPVRLHRATEQPSGAPWILATALRPDSCRARIHSQAEACRLVSISLILPTMHLRCCTLMPRFRGPYAPASYGHIHPHLHTPLDQPELIIFCFSKILIVLLKLPDDSPLHALPPCGGSYCLRRGRGRIWMGRGVV